jgi:thiamine-phosphate pyrophosphorylase
VTRNELSGLYAITSRTVCADASTLAAAVEAALRGGAVLIQYRDKQADAAARLANARTLADLCRAYRARLIVNDDVALAEAAGAAGVHLGAGDGSLATARARLGPQAIIGASCGPHLERALAAVAAGASYVAFGRFFDSNTKPDAPQAHPDVLRAARAQLSVPICAIGGVTAGNGAQLLAAGANLLAAIEGVFGTPAPADVERAARAYSRLFDL